MANQYSFPLHEGKTIDGVQEAVCRFLNFSKMQIQTLDHGKYRIVQARTPKSGAKKLIGMDKAVEVRIYQEAERVHVEIGEAKWADKAAVMMLSMFFLWPLTITSGVGIYQQKQLLNDLRAAIEQYIYS